jgi:hypothetical protein
VVAAGVSVFIAATGGFVRRWGPLRISARAITNPTVVAVLGAVAAWLLSTRDERRGFAVTVVDVVRDPRRHCRSLTKQALYCECSRSENV